MFWVRCRDLQTRRLVNFWCTLHTPASACAISDTSSAMILACSGPPGVNVDCRKLNAHRLARCQHASARQHAWSLPSPSAPPRPALALALAPGPMPLLESFHVGTSTGCHKLHNEIDSCSLLVHGFVLLIVQWGALPKCRYVLAQYTGSIRDTRRYWE